MTTYDLVSLIFLGLSTWRLTYLLVVENGPYMIFLRFRLLIGIEYFNGNEPIGKKETIEIINQLGSNALISRPKNEIAKVFSCLWCASVWVALLLVVVNGVLQNEALEIFRMFLVVLSVSTISIKLESIG